MDILHFIYVSVLCCVDIFSFGRVKSKIVLSSMISIYPFLLYLLRSHRSRCARFLIDETYFIILFANILSSTLLMFILP
jgi:hypothetical protein